MRGYIPFCCCLLLIGMGISMEAEAQFKNFDPDISVELGFVAGEGDSTLPFWLHANQDGIVDRFGENGYAIFSLNTDYKDLGPFQYRFGADLVSRVSENSSVFLNQGYLQARWGIFRLTAGRKVEPMGLRDTSLSMGSMSVSRNASPPTKISISIPHFVEVPGTKGWISFKGLFTHGKMEGNRFVKNALLHQKYLFVRLLPHDSFIRAYAGITHNALWGGSHPSLGDLPDSFKDFWLIFTVRASDAIDAEPGAEEEALGSSIGTYDFGLSMELFNLKINVYRQFYSETSAGAQLRNPWDGLWGLGLNVGNKTSTIRKILWEHIYTKSQSAQIHRGTIPFGRDNYYNHSVYESGWTFHGRTIGNPLLFSDGINPGVDNNIVVAHHLGLEGVLGGFVPYKMMGTYSRNYGSRRVCIDEECTQKVNRITEPQDQYSLLMQMNGPINDTVNIRLSLAYDFGTIYEDQLGGQFGIIFRY